MTIKIESGKLIVDGHELQVVVPSFFIVQVNQGAVHVNKGSNFQPYLFAPEV